MTGRNPVDRSKAGSKIRVLADRHGIPLSVAVSGANTRDCQALKPLVMAIPAIRSRRGRRRRKLDKLHADKAYDSRELCGGTQPGHRRPHRPQGRRVQREAGADTAGSSNASSPGRSTSADSPPATNNTATTSALSHSGRSAEMLQETLT
jgi:hypothetical protein